MREEQRTPAGRSDVVIGGLLTFDSQERRRVATGRKGVGVEVARAQRDGRGDADDQDESAEGSVETHGVRVW